MTIKEINEKLTSNTQFLDVTNSEKTRKIRYYRFKNQYEANDGISPDKIISSSYDESLDICSITIDIQDSKNKLEELKLASESLMKYLAENYHPHVTAIVTGNRCEIMEGIRSHHNDEFIKD